jgi:hypothetical protein
MPGAAARAALLGAFPDALLHTFGKQGHALERELKWLGSHRYATLHLHGDDAADLRRRAERASALLGWPAPYAPAAEERPSESAPAPSRPATPVLTPRLQPLR